MALVDPQYGEIVFLVSGSPAMTISHLRDWHAKGSDSTEVRMIGTIWFADDTLQTGWFPEPCLTMDKPT